MAVGHWAGYLQVHSRPLGKVSAGYPTVTLVTGSAGYQAGYVPRPVGLEIGLERGEAGYQLVWPRP